MIYRVRCTLEIDVDMAGYDNPEFVIEDNSCPATGPVWAALSKVIEDHDEKNTCWACALNGKNEIISTVTGAGETQFIGPHSEHEIATT